MKKKIQEILGEPDSKTKSSTDSHKTESSKKKESTQYQDHTDNEFPIIEKIDAAKIYTHEYNVPGLLITIDPDDLVNKIVYYGNKNANTIERINNDQFRVTHGNGKSRIMDYAEIIRQLIHPDEEASDRWVIEAIVDHVQAKDEKKEKLTYV